MIALETARRLLDFRGPTGALSEAAAEEQLRGAVALHNILERHRVAYLADEVGMGKTYVALGALALLRHFDPRLRVLVIAPRANIQGKWIKELKNFTRNNVRLADLRVKAVHGAPARPIVSCDNLAELVRETAHNPDRDFFVRLSSFSLPVGEDSESLKRRRKELLRHLPWAPDDFDLRSRERFKDAYGRTLCMALPVFDLVVVDEAHHLKHGFAGRVAARNRVLALAFGHPRGAPPGSRGYGPRARRVLFLSATPLEADYRQLWNQLDLFGLGDAAPELGPQGDDVSEDGQRACAQRFLIRRLAHIPVAEQRLTKNLYRREWRAGGVARHDHPLEIAGPDRDRQRLIVALVQKKVSEVLGHERFNNTFQIGMLASFESFLRTSQVLTSDDGDDGATFDGDQSDDPDERLGLDVGQVNRLAASYRRHFEGAELPHPKMDALVDHLAEDLPQGRKALVFVRRVASVKELQAKLEERYDAWLFDRLRRDLPELRPGLERAFQQYRDERARRSTLARATPSISGPQVEDEEEVEPTDARPAPEASGLDSFFAWFFRGDGPDGFLSGAALKKRFERPGSALSTFFEDNYAAWLLRARPGHVLDALAAHLGRGRDDVAAELRQRAAALVPASASARGARRRQVFLALQEAALELLATRGDDLAQRAELVLRLVLSPTRRAGGRVPDDAEGWLETPTFFTELRARPELRARLWPEPQAHLAFGAALREQELRRALLSGQARHGHAFLDLYVLALQAIGDLRPRARDEDASPEGLIESYLDLLDRQRLAADGSFGAFQELSQTAEHFDLILDTSGTRLRTAPLSEAGREVGTFLGSQQPVGGMWGAVNKTLVQQFRLPGYPFVLFTTDLLQEGEDLHLFCSSVHHYGISWAPSSMEQRVGRIDRVNSHTERRLERLERAPEGSHKLQVYYPHLRETVERLQVRRVLERMTRFVRLMHRDLRPPDEDDRRIDLTQAMLQPETALETIDEPLESAFPVRDEWLDAPEGALAVDAAAVEGLLARFQRLQDARTAGLTIDWERRQPSPDMLLGTVWLASGRRQPFSLVLRSHEGRLMVRCVSPVGLLPAESEPIVRSRTLPRPVQVGAVWDDRSKTYNVNVESEVLLGPPEVDEARVFGLVARVVTAADDLECELLQRDAPLSAFANDITQESPDAGA